MTYKVRLLCEVGATQFQYEAVIESPSSEEPEGLRPYQLAQALGKNPSTTRSLLKKMRQDGEVRLEEGVSTTGTPVATDDQQVNIVATDDQQVNAEKPGVHAVHAVCPDSIPPEITPVVDTLQEEPPVQPVDTGNTVDTVDAMDDPHTEDSRNRRDTVDAGNTGHRGNSGDSGDTANSLDAGNSVDSGDRANRENSDNNVDTLEEDPLLSPDPSPSMPGEALQAARRGLPHRVYRLIAAQITEILPPEEPVC